LIQIDVRQGEKKPSIPGTIKKPVAVVVTPKPRKDPLPVTKKPKKNPSVIDIIIGGVLPIATNPIIPGTGTTLLPVIPGEITTPISPNVPIGGQLPGAVGDIVGGIGDAIGDIKLPAFPDLGLPNIGKFFDDLKVGGGLVLLGIGGLIALFILTRNK